MIQRVQHWCNNHFKVNRPESKLLENKKRMMLGSIGEKKCEFGSSFKVQKKPLDIFYCTSTPMQLTKFSQIPKPVKEEATKKFFSPRISSNKGSNLLGDKKHRLN
jgi:hypothetical protein